MNPSPQSDLTQTQRGINVRLMLAQDAYTAAQHEREVNDCPLTRAALAEAAETLRKLRSEPMKSLAPYVPAEPKIYAELREV